MRAGKLRHKLELLRPVDAAANAAGDFTTEYEVLPGMVWGAIEPLSGSELWHAQQVRAQLSHKVTIRGRTDITSRWRVKFNGRTFELGPPLSEDERGIQTEFAAEEMVRL